MKTSMNATVNDFKYSGQVRALVFSPDDTMLYTATDPILALQRKASNDFINTFPTAAIILSPLSKEQLTPRVDETDNLSHPPESNEKRSSLWVTAFMAEILGAHLKKPSEEALLLVKSLLDSGLKVLLLAEVPPDDVRNEKYYENCVKTAFPQLATGLKSRLEIMYCTDNFPGHNDAKTTIIWVFPRLAENIQVWDVKSLTLKQRTNLCYTEEDATLMAHGSMIKDLATSISDGKMTETPIISIFDIDVSHDGKLLALACGLEVRVFQIDEEGTPYSSMAVLRGHKDDVNSVSFSADGSIVVSASSDGTVILWDINSKRNIGTFGNINVPLGSARLTSNKLLIAGGGTMSRGGHIFFWDISTGTCIKVLDDFSAAGLHSVALSPIGSAVAYSCVNSAIGVIDLVSDTMNKYRYGVGMIESMFYLADDQNFAVCSNTSSSPIGDISAIVSGGRVTICGPSFERPVEICASNEGIITAAISRTRDMLAVGFGDGVKLIRFKDQ